MHLEDYIPEALILVSAWEISEEDFAQAVHDQARLMVGLLLEPSGDLPVTSPYACLQF